MWAGVKGYLDQVTETAASPMVAKYTGLLASAVVAEFTYTTMFMLLQSMRPDLGASS